MKKLVALFLICSLYHSASAQKFDKKLLYGKWELHALTSSDGYSWDNDSFGKSISALLMIMKNEQRGMAASAEDSIRLAGALKESFKDFSNCFIQFDKKGKCHFMLVFNKEASGYLKPYKGTYNLATNIITIHVEHEPDAIYLIESLNSTELVVGITSSGKNENGFIKNTSGTMRFAKH